MDSQDLKNNSAESSQISTYFWTPIIQPSNQPSVDLSTHKLQGPLHTPFMHFFRRFKDENTALSSGRNQISGDEEGYRQISD